MTQSFVKMPDIVERLRNPYNHFGDDRHKKLMDEAAAEIERLQAKVETKESLARHCCDEIERLKGKLAAERERCVQILKWYATDDGRLMQNDSSLIVADIRSE